MRVIASILDRIGALGLPPRAGTLRPDVGSGVRVTVNWPYRIEGQEVQIVRITRGLVPPSRGN
jgi:plasmid stabilization system protein ParE